MYISARPHTRSRYSGLFANQFSWRSIAFWSTSSSAKPPRILSNRSVTTGAAGGCSAAVPEGSTAGDSAVLSAPWSAGPAAASATRGAAAAAAALLVAAALPDWAGPVAGTLETVTECGPGAAVATP